MKTTVILLGIALLATLTATARSLEITVPNVRSNKGTLLVMATTPEQEKPFYAMAAARTGTQVITLDIANAENVLISLFHDEDGDYQMKMGDRGPLEGYGRKQCNNTKEQSAIEIPLNYPTTAATEDHQTK